MAVGDGLSPVLDLRFALRADDLERLERLLARGATLIHEPVVTPRSDDNVRRPVPVGMQVALVDADAR